MEDIYFSRIGLALSRFVTAIELAPQEKAEVEALATELQTFEGSINGLIDQRVQARLDQIDGAALSGLNALTDRVTALEGGVEKIADELDPPADTVAAPDTTTSTVAGGTGDDSVAGAAGDDSVAAGAGDDGVSGGTADDSISTS